MKMLQAVIVNSLNYSIGFRFKMKKAQTLHHLIHALDVFVH